LILLVFPAFTNHSQANILGLIAITSSSAVRAGSLIYTRKAICKVPTLIMSTTILFLTTLYLLPFSLLIEHPFSLPIPSVKAIGALLALSIIGTALVSLVYFHIFERINVTKISMTTFLIPLFGTILGVVVLDEQLTWNIYLGGIFIVLSVIMIHEIFKPFGFTKCGNNLTSKNA
jgi:drug/metabolite transporter (DMT)-like permease